MSIKIDEKEFSGFVDHDYEKLKNLSISGRIVWFKYRYNKILFEPIEVIDKIIQDEGPNARLENENVSIRTIVILIVCVGIDLLGGFLDGREYDTDKTSFKPFVDKYLDRKNEYPSNSYNNISEFSELLYMLFRCGLAHNLTIKKVGFGYGEKYFRREGENYYISADKLYEDFKQAFDNYIKDVEKDKNYLQDKFSRRFEHVFIRRE